MEMDMHLVQVRCAHIGPLPVHGTHTGPLPWRDSDRVGILLEEVDGTSRPAHDPRRVGEEVVIGKEAVCLAVAGVAQQRDGLASVGG